MELVISHNHQQQQKNTTKKKTLKQQCSKMKKLFNFTLAYMFEIVA